MVEGDGFEPSKAEPADLQSDPFDRSGTPPHLVARFLRTKAFLASASSVELAGQRQKASAIVRMGHRLGKCFLQNF